MRRFAPLFLSIVAACGGGTSSALSEPKVDTLPGGIAHVANSGPSAWRDTNGWKLVLERTIHPPAGTPGELVHPQALVASSNGDIFVLERKLITMKHYGADGAFLGTIGRDGEGPGEFRDYGVLYVVRDTLIHQDAGQSRLSAFTTAGQFISTWPSPHMAERDLVADTSGRIPVPASSGANRINSGHGVIRFRLDGTVVDSLWYPSAPEPRTWSLKNEHTDMAMLVPFVPDRVNVLDRGGRLIWGDQSAGHFVYSSNGRDTVRIVDAAFTAAPLPDSLRQATLDDALKHDAWLQGIAQLSDIPRTYPRWTGIVADGANNLWILLPGPRGEGDHWQVLDPDGRLLGAVPAPFNHVDNAFWTADHVYVIEDAADGTPAVLVYRITKGNH